MEQTFTMMAEEETPEVGPNDIVIHLVNPYKCGMCELEFLDKAVFKDHIFSHLEQLKQEKPSSQIVMNIVLPPETPGGVTVTRDILQLGEDGSIKQVIQPANNITLNQVYPLKELEAAGVIKLEPPHPIKPAPIASAIPVMATQAVNLPNPLAGKDVQPLNAVQGTLENIPTLEHSQNSVGAFIKEEEGETDVSEIIENTDGTFSVAFKGPNNEMQHIQIIRPEGMKGEMMLELTNVHNRRRSSKGVSKSNECDICGKVLSSSTNLLRHKMYHSSERPFVCNTCGKGFKDVSNLKKHTMIHNRIFPCHLCKKSFLRKSLLVMHLKRHQARTVFVKCGNGAKEVTLRTFVDSDSTRVEEMSMVALSGQTFEYKKRIVKALPSDVKVAVVPDDQMEGNASNATADAVASVEGVSTNVDGVELKLDCDSSSDHDLSIKETQPVVSGEALDDLPEFKVPEPPKEFVKMYQCGHCGKRTVQRGNMMRHLIHHLTDKPFRCDECPKQFVDKGELVKHKKTHSKPYRCNECHGAFAHNVQLIKHQESECLGRTGELKYTTLEDGQTYRCDICQIEMKRLGNMIKHVGTHSSGKQGSALRYSDKKFPKTGMSSSSIGGYTFNKGSKMYICSYCPKTFKQKSNLLSHVLIHEHPYDCPDCDRSFPSRMALVRHSAVHLKPFKCDRCPAVFSRKLFLETHMRRHKEKERGEETDDYGVSEDQSQYYCKHCDMKLLQKFRMMNHIRSHLDNRLYECPECNKCFSGQFMLSNHKKVHAKLFTCEICGEAFTRKLFLQIHRKKHHHSVMKSMDDNKEFSVLDSDKGIAPPYQLSLIDGNDSKSYSCFICGSSFSRLVIKLNHEKKCKEEMKILSRVANGNGYRCKICRRVSTLKHNLMVHIRKAHCDVVKFNPSGHIDVKGQSDLSNELADSNSEEEFPISDDDDIPAKKRAKLQFPTMREELSDDDDAEALALEEAMEEGDESDTDTDDRYTRTPGGFACATCRTKFSEREALLSHLDSHSEETGKDKESQNPETEKANPSEEGETPNRATPSADRDSQVSQKENTTPRRNQGRPPGSTKTKTQSAKVKAPKTPSTPSVTVTRDADSAHSPTSLSRSSNRPPRTQKIPSRFLE